MKEAPLLNINSKTNKTGSQPVSRPVKQLKKLGVGAGCLTAPLAQTDTQTNRQDRQDSSDSRAGA